MSKIVRNAMHASIAAALVAGVSIGGATSAFAGSDIYTCTATYPEVCLGVNNNGANVVGETAQVNLDHNTWYQYVILDESTGDETSTIHLEKSSAGWAGIKNFNFTDNGEYCAWVNYGPTTNLGQTSQEACATFPSPS